MVCCQIVDLDKASFAVLLVLSAARRLVLIQIESTLGAKKGRIIANWAGRDGFQAAYGGWVIGSLKMGMDGGIFG